MKSILVKRLKVVFAFRKTLDWFLKSYSRFIEMAKVGDIYISKR
jgi:hypothetical protein